VLQTLQSIVHNVQSNCKLAHINKLITVYHQTYRCVRGGMFAICTAGPIAC